MLKKELWPIIQRAKAHGFFPNITEKTTMAKMKNMVAPFIAGEWFIFTNALVTPTGELRPFLAFSTTGCATIEEYSEKYGFGHVVEKLGKRGWTIIMETTPDGIERFKATPSD